MKVGTLLLVFAVLIFSIFTYGTGSDQVTTKSSRLTIGGRLQTQYQYIEAADTSRFLLRRARVTFTSKLTEWISLKLQLEAGMQKFTLKDAYIDFNLKHLDIFIGQKHVPFSREAFTSSKYLQMIERSRSSEFAPFRQVGIGLQGFAWGKRFEYMAGIYNGAVDASSVSNLANNRLSKVKIYHIDVGASADNNKFLYAGRIDFHPLGYMKKEQSYLDDLEHPLLSIGINLFSSDDSPKGGHTPGAAELKKTLAYGGDAAFNFKGFAGTFEYIYRELSWWNTADQVNNSPQYTYSLQGGFMVIPKRFELTARYEFVKYDKNGLLFGPEGQNTDKWLTLGCNYFFAGHHMKIQFNYIQKREDMPAGMPGPDNNTALVQFAYYF